MQDLQIEITKDPENNLRDIITCKNKGLRIRVYDTAAELPDLPEYAVTITHEIDTGNKMIFEIMDADLYTRAHGWDALLYNYAIDWYLSMPRNNQEITAI
jgi:hypothetical protein